MKYEIYGVLALVYGSMASHIHWHCALGVRLVINVNRSEVKFPIDSQCIPRRDQRSRFPE